MILSHNEPGYMSIVLGQVTIIDCSIEELQKSTVGEFIKLVGEFIKDQWVNHITVKTNIIFHYIVLDCGILPTV